MKIVLEGTLHIEGRDNHLYGYCYRCSGLLHLGVLGGEYNLIPFGKCWGLSNKWTEIDPAQLLAQDDHEVLAEAYGFELRKGWGHEAAHLMSVMDNRSCVCRLDAHANMPI